MFGLFNAKPPTPTPPSPSALPVPEPHFLPDVPDFTDEGITDQAEIARELLEGPPIAISVGSAEETQLITLPVRLALHHSPEIREHLEQYGNREPYVYSLPDDSMDALKFVVQWMHTGGINIPELQKIRDSVSRTALMECCFLLWRIWCISDRLEIDEIDAHILSKLKEAFDLARGCGILSPIHPKLIHKASKDYTEIKDLENEEINNCDFWNALLGELSQAFTTKPLTNVVEYSDCFGIAAFSKAILPVLGKQGHIENAPQTPGAMGTSLKRKLSDSPSTLVNEDTNINKKQRGFKDVGDGINEQGSSRAVVIHDRKDGGNDDGGSEEGSFEL